MEQDSFLAFADFPQYVRKDRPLRFQSVEIKIQQGIALRLLMRVEIIEE